MTTSAGDDSDHQLPRCTVAPAELLSAIGTPALVTDELIEERWTSATEPATPQSARRM